MNKLRQILRSAPSDVLAEVAQHGWVLTVTGSGHVKWLHPNGAFTFSSSTPSDRRSWANHLARMRRARRQIALIR